MEANPYDSIDSAALGSLEDAPVGNEYEAAYKENLQNGLKASSFIATGKNPDHHAKVVSLAEQLGAKSQFVEENYDVIEKQREERALKLKLGQLGEATPGVAEFITDPDNLALTKDDLDELMNIEKSIQSRSFTSQAYNAFGAGLANTYSGLAKIPAYVGNVSLIPSNIYRKATGQEQVAYEMDNSVSEYFEQGAGQYAELAPNVNKSPLAEVSKGNYAQAGQTLALQIINNAPQQLVILGSALMGAPMIGLGIAGGSSAANKASELQGQGTDPLLATGVAASHGAIEVAFERLGTLGVLKKWESSLAKDFGKQTAKQVMFNFSKTLTSSMLQEGSEESATSLAQDFTDYITGVNPDAMKGSIARAIDAGAVGAGSGGVMTSPVGFTAGLAKQQQIRQAKVNQQFYTALGEASTNSKLKQRLPEKHRQLVEHLTKDGPVENAYIDTEAFNEYFQSKNINPVQVAQELGISEQYNAAIEAGSDIEIKTAVLAQKLAGTEHYQGLANDVKFNPEDLTVNQAKKLDAESKIDLEQEYEKSKETATEEQVETVETSAKEVYQDIVDQLKANNYSDKSARAQAKLYESFFKTVGIKSGKMPMELYQKYGLRIRNIDEAVAEETAPPEVTTYSELNPNFKINNEVDIPEPDIVMTEAVVDENGALSNIDVPSLESLRIRIAESEAGYRQAKVDDAGNDLGTIAMKSTFPDFIKDKGYTKKEMLNVIDKYKSGKKLTEKQTDLLLYIYNGMVDKVNRKEYFQDYRGQHTSPGPDANLKNRLDDLSETLPDIYDIDLKTALRYYGYHDKKADTEVIKIIQSLKNNPEADIKIYRAVPKGINDINSGDWVSLTKYYADLHGESRFDGKFEVVEKTVKAKELYNAGDIQEWGYHSEAKKELFQSSKLLGSDGSIEGIIKGIEKFWYSSPGTIKLVETSDGTFDVHNTKGKVDGVRVVKKGKRFRFEMMTDAFKQDKRGSISFGNNRKFDINLFKAKDESTFLHESAHFFLEVMGDLAESKEATESIKKDYQSVLDLLKVKNRSEVGVDQHEIFARSFEAYLMEGKAPTTELRKAFNTIKQWFINIYKQVKALGVEVSPEMAGVFDRLLATEDQLNLANEKLGPSPMFGDPSIVGMNESEQLEYLNAIEWARISASDELRTRLMKDLIKKKDASYKNKYNEIYDAEMVKAKEMIEFKTIAAITSDLKLSKPVLEKYYSVFNGYIPRGSTQVDGGLHPDVVASMFGYENGQAMLQAIAPMQRGIEWYVEREVATKMRQQFPELLESPELSEEAIKAAHSDKAGLVKRLELEYLAKNDPTVLKNVASRLIRRMPSTKAVKEQAASIIGSTNVRELKPHVFRNAEKKHALEASKQYKSGNFAEAFEAKRKEYLNFELYRAATTAQDDVKKSITNFKKLFKADENLAKSRDMDLVNAAKAILSEYGITRSEKTTEDYLSKIKQYDPEGYSVISAHVSSALQNKGNYQEVKYDHFVDMRDAVMSIYDLAKSKKEIEIDGEIKNIDDVMGELSTQLNAITPKQAEEYQQTVTKWGLFKEKLLGAKASLIRAEHWAKAIDVKDGGPFHKIIFRPVSDAVTRYRLKKVEVMKKYLEIMKSYESNVTRDAIEAKQLKFIFKDKAELMMAILHTGNESNKRKLLLGRGWAELNDDNTLSAPAWDSFIEEMQANGTLKKEDYDFAQSIWDLMDSLKPEAQKAHKKMYGYYFNEITAETITTPFGEYRGGYIPAKADVHSVEDAAIRREREEFENNNNSFQYPTTGRGFTKGRVEQYTVPLSLDVNMLGSHIDGVLKFSYIEPVVKQTAKIVLDKGFRQQLAKLDTNIAKDMLVPWLQRTAQQKVVLPAQDGLGRMTDAAAKFLRKNVATQMMMGNITNTLQQVTGLVVAMSKVEPRYIRNGLFKYVMQNKSTVESIMEKSEWMRSVQGENIFDINNSINEIILNKSTFEKAQDFTRKHTYFLQSAAQNMVNTVVWTGAYEQAIIKGMTEYQAIKDADSAVRTTQGTTNPEDISRYETGTATELMFKQFVSYFNMIANLNASELVRISRDVGLRKGAGRAFYIYMTAFMLPAVLSDIIVKAMSGRFDDDDDESYIDDALTSFFGSQFKTFAATVPYGGQVAVAAYNKAFTKNMSDDRLSLSPALSILESAVASPIQIYQSIADNGDVKKKTVKDALQLVGIMTGLPTGPVGRPLGYVMDVESGRAKPTGPVDYTRGLITGKAGQ